MSKKVDSRVVEMRFDNQQFEQGARETISTLDKLKAKLNFKGVADGLSEVDQVANKTDLNPLVRAVDTVQTRFSAMQVVAMTTLANITNSAINTGKSLIKSLSIDQVTAGWSKYGQKTASVQTIMNATGKTIDEVNTYLDKLMWFSDETSYGFTDMTQALGQLTSAGGDIDKLIPMIEGIANATAYAGKGTGEFSRAIYNLNQSYSAGNLQYMDWKSLELAGIASKELKQVFIDTGVALGKIKKDEVTIANFGQTLSSKWATTEVMEKAFGSFAEMTEKAYEMINSGEVETASEAYEILAKQYNNVAMKAAKSAQEAKTFTEAIEATKDAVSSGYLKSFEIIFGNYEEAKILWTELANRLWDTFASGSEARNEMLGTWKDLGGRTTLINTFWKLWDNVASVLGTVKEAFRDIFPPMTAEKLYKLTLGFEQFIDRVKPSEDSLDKLKLTFKGLFAAVDIVKQLFSSILSAIFPDFLSGTGALIDRFLDFTAAVGDTVVEFRDFVVQSELFNRISNKIISVLKNIWSRLASIYSLLKEKIVVPLINVILNLLGRTDDRLETVTGSVDRLTEKTNKFKAVIDKIKNSGIVKFMSALLGYIKQIASITFDKISGFLNGAADKLKEAKFSDILDVLNALLTGGLILTLGRLPKTILSIFRDIKGVVSKATGALNILVEGITMPFKSLANAIDTMSSKVNIEIIFEFCKAIAILAAALLVLSLIDSDKLAISLGAITLLFAELMGALALFVKIFQKNSGTIKDAAQQAKQLGAMVTMAKVLVKMAIAMLILSLAVAKLGSMDLKSLAKGLLSVAVLLGAVIASVWFLSNYGGKTGVKGVSSVITLAMSLLILAGVMKILASISWDELGRGLIGFVSIIGVVTAALILLGNKGGKTIKGSTAMFGIAMSLLLLAGVMKILASISWDELGRGLIGFVSIIGVVTAALILLGKMGGSSLMGSASLLVAANALLILAAALMIISMIPVKKMVSGLLGVTAAIAILAVSAAIIGPLSVVVLALAGAIALLGVGALACATGMLVFVSALALIATISEAAFAAIVAGMSLIIIGLAQLIPTIVKYIAEGFVQIIVTIGQNAAIIGQTILQLIIAFCDTIIQAVPKIMETIGSVLDGIINLLVEYVPKIVNAALQIIVGVLDGITQNLPAIIQSAFDLIVSFIEGVSAAVGNEENVTRLTNAAWDLVTSFISAIFTCVGASFGKIHELGETLMESEFIKGIKDKVSGIWTTIVNGVKTAILKVNEKITEFRNAGNNLMTGLKDGIVNGFKKVWSSVKDACTGLVDKVKDVFGIHSPSKVFEEIGQYIDGGLSEGIRKFSGLVNKEGADMCDGLTDTVKSGLGDLSTITDSIDSNPTITPVLDLSKIEEGAKKITGIFSNRQAIYAAAEDATNRESRVTGTTINMTINASEGQDVRELADIIAERINNSVRKKEYAWK